MNFIRGIRGYSTSRKGSVLLPKHVDWRDRKGVFIKDQGNALIPKHVDWRERERCCDPYQGSSKFR
jgi:hypothetical protein